MRVLLVYNDGLIDSFDTIYDPDQQYAHAQLVTFVEEDDEDERRFMARVEKVEDDGVTIDTNHPLAGRTLQFTGLVLENREATKEEIQHMLNHLSGEGCGCGCEDCEDGCGHHHDHGHEGGCGCGHCH